MPEMILDSLFLITNAYIDKHKKLPMRVCVRRKGVSRLYHIATVLDIACKVTGMAKPKSLNNFKHVRGILHKAVCVMHRLRRQSPYRFLLKDGVADSGHRDNLVDLRDAFCNVAGMARERLVSVAQGTTRPPTQQEAEAAIEMMRRAELVVVNDEKEAFRLQHYLAERALTPLVVHAEVAAPLNQPVTVGQWSEPTVAHQ